MSAAAAAVATSGPGAKRSRPEPIIVTQQLQPDVGDAAAIDRARRDLTFKRPKHATVKIGWIQRSFAAPLSMYTIVSEQLSFLRRELADFLPEPLMESLESHLEWAHRREDGLVVSVMFWWLYASFDTFRQMVHEVEMKANPHIRDVTLLKISKFVIERISALKSSPFEPGNARALFLDFYAHMNLGVNVRHPAVLDKRPFDPSAMSVGQDPMLLATRADREVMTRVQQDIDRMKQELREQEEELRR